MYNVQDLNGIIFAFRKLKNNNFAVIEYESFLNTIEDELYCSLVQIGGKIPLQYFEAFGLPKGLQFMIQLTCLSVLFELK